MADLRVLFIDLGFCDVQTVVQSGNVVFSSSLLDVQAIEERIEGEVRARLGLRSLVFVRSAADCQSLILANPFPREALSDPSHLLAIFYKCPLDLDQVESIQKAIKGPERISAVGRELFAVYPDGIGTSTIGKTPGWSKLAASGTGRNWNTVLKIAELLAS